MGVSRSLTISVLFIVLASVAGFFAEVSGGVQGYVRIAAIPVRGRMLGVYNRYAVGFVSTIIGSMLSAVDIYTGESRTLAIAESIGLQPESTRFYETENHFAVFDGKLLLIFNKDAELVGRFAGDNVKGFVLLPSGNLVVWGRDYVAFAKAPRYTSIVFYDVWEQVFKLFNESVVDPRSLLTIAGINADAEIAKMRKNLYDAARSVNGTVLREDIDIFFDILAPTVREARQKLNIDVVSAIVLSNGTGYVAVNIFVPIVIRVYGVVQYQTEEGKDEIEIELMNNYPLSLGALAKLGSSEVIEIYDTIDGGASGSAMVYIYKPLITSLKTRYIRIIHEDGSSVEVPIYFSGHLTDIYVAGKLVLVRLDTDVAMIYSNQSLLWTFTTTRITDVGVMPDGRLYVTYLNALGAHELGIADLYSGRVDKISIDIPYKAVGIHVSSDYRFIVSVVQIGDEDAELWIYTLASSIARLRLMFIDTAGAVVPAILWGRATITSGELRYSVSIIDNPAILVVPAPSTIDIAVDVPYGRAVERIDVVKPGNQTYSVVVQVKPEHLIIDRGNILPFTSPFYLDHVLIKDTEILRFSLPGARYLDSYGTYVLLLHETKPGEPSKISLYSIDGRELWSKIIGGYITEARIFFPYIVVRGFSEIHVLDISSGATKASVVSMVEGYDIDLDTEYLSVWSKRVVAILDIRRGEVSFIDMFSYGTVLVAPIVGGSVFAYVQSGDVVNIYIINPHTKSIVEVLPLGAQTVTRFATDGRFKAVSYIIDGKSYTSLLSSYNGLVNIPSGPIVSVKTIGKVASLPAGASMLYGNMFSVLLVSEDTACTVYAAGMNYVKLLSLEGVSTEDLIVNTLFIAERVIPVNATPMIVLRDFSGASRVIIVPSIVPTVFTASEQLVAYSDKEHTYVIPNPRVIGNYLLSVKVEDAETGKPINGVIEIKEYGIKTIAEGGRFRTYLSLPGALTLKVSAPFYVSEEVRVELTDEKPVASISVKLKPQLFTLSVRVVTFEGEEVREGTLSVFSEDPPTSITIDLSKTNRVEGLRTGRYEVLFTSDVFTTAYSVVELTSDTEIILKVNRTAIQTFFRVLDELGRPVENARVVLVLERVGEIELTTDRRGETQMILLPYGAIINYTASARGYTSRRESFTADLTVNRRPIVITLSRFKGILTIMVRDAEGNPLTASVTIKDAMGNDVLPVIPVIDTYVVDLEIGTYTVVAIAPDGRETRTVVTISEDMPSAVALLVFETPPQPSYVAYFPLVLVIVIVSTVAVAIYKRFFRKTKPRVVT
ncbi:MAG: hypothetical protein QXE70_10450 [Ignisphaera sp.]